LSPTFQELASDVPESVAHESQRGELIATAAGIDPAAKKG